MAKQEEAERLRRQEHRKIILGWVIGVAMLTLFLLPNSNQRRPELLF